MNAFISFTYFIDFLDCQFHALFNK